MKKQTLAILAIVAMALVGCGTKEKPNSSSTSSALNTNCTNYADGGYYCTQTQTNNYYTNLVSKIQNGEFATAQNSRMKYSYARIKTSTKWGVIAYSQYIANSYTNTSIAGGTFSSQTSGINTRAALQTFLSDLVSSPVYYYMKNLSTIRVQDSSGIVYEINTALPLEANPVAKIDMTGNGYEFTHWSPF